MAVFKFVGMDVNFLGEVDESFSVDVFGRVALEVLVVCNVLRGFRLRNRGDSVCIILREVWHYFYCYFHY